MKNEDLAKTSSRDAVIVRTSIIGILANVFLAAFKAVVGLTANSIAIVMDAVNNLTDAAGSVITIVGTKLAGKEADKVGVPMDEREFHCRGEFKGLHKGRPNADDVAAAAAFAKSFLA